MTDTRSPQQILGAAAAGLKSLLVGADPPAPRHGRRRQVAVGLVVAAGATYLAYGAMTYLERKSGLPVVLCLLGGVALAGPFVLLVTRPLLAWRVAWLTAVVTGAAVQAHHRTPFSWHPAILVMQLVILFVIARRLPFVVAAWAWASMAVLISVSFYPADRVSLIVITAGLMGVAVLPRLVGHGRRTAVR